MNTPPPPSHPYTVPCFPKYQYQTSITIRTLILIHWVCKVTPQGSGTEVKDVGSLGPDLAFGGLHGSRASAVKPHRAPSRLSDMIQLLHHAAGYSASQLRLRALPRMHSKHSHPTMEPLYAHYGRELGKLQQSDPGNFPFRLIDCRWCAGENRVRQKTMIFNY
ncbi:uncharacterized protein PADG_08488 [Paracoccidioides brasiliensis Pb18]|uniref:Uncharacterized protein n=1 Tax=Paracoccidioides brasiliensis (strain Pb18) TaxID=502780 RepID=C1GMK2_PARBD|nr:uncharacterized protein PADG_08488 [Paracoccidioides brasiliensis Pb18]EEH43668.2 hypothetical protein PADG_08488 [Paracoccidioides brasiliensis Pb18]